MRPEASLRTVTLLCGVAGRQRGEPRLGETGEANLSYFGLWCAGAREDCGGAGRQTGVSIVLRSAVCGGEEGIAGALVFRQECLS